MVALKCWEQVMGKKVMFWLGGVERESLGHYYGKRENTALLSWP